MKRVSGLLVGTLLCAGVMLAGTSPFERYGVKETFEGTPARPVLNQPFFRLFRTRIQRAARKGPNFAGHYAIAEWGCGTSCVSGALIDVGNGRVAQLPFKTLSYGRAVRYADTVSRNDENFQPLVYRRNSRLLLVRGCPGDYDVDCALFQYEWDGSRFKLLKYVKAKDLAPEELQ